MSRSSGKAAGSAPLFSIVIPTHNRAEQVRRAIESCLAQTFAGFEVIVVDDGSNDGTDDVVASIADPRVRYLKQANAGAGAARNHGADAARGEFLAFLDSDDEFLPGKLAAFERELARAGARAGECVWYSQLLFFRGNGNQLIKPTRPIRPDEPVGDYLFADEGLMQTSTLVMAKKLFDTIRFDPELRQHMDLDLCLRLEAAGARFRMISGPQTIWHNEGGFRRISTSTGADGVTAWAERYRALLSERAYHGFLARFLAPRLVRTSPMTALRLLARGLRERSLSPARAVTILARGAAPELYGTLRDALVRLSRRGRAARPSRA